MIKFISPPGSVVEKQPKIGFIFSLRFFIYLFLVIFVRPIISTSVPDISPSNLQGW